MIGAAGRTRPFNPFALIPILFGKSARERHSGSLVLPWIVVGLVVVIVTSVEGTLGTAADIRWVSDVRSVFGRSVPETPPRVPLMRDAPDLVLFLLVVIAFVVLHRQWQRIGDCLTDLREAGTITPRDRPRRTWLAIVFGLYRVIGTEADSGALDRLERRLEKFPARLRVFLSIVVVVGGLVLAVLLRHALDENVLQVFVPTGLSSVEQEQWLAEARANWWAGSSHPGGYLLYTLITWLGMSLIVAYNVMGLVTVYVAICVFMVIRPKADWLNRDGRYGWLPMVRVYRSVYWTIVLFCIVISVLVALLGPATPIAIIGLIALYTILIPIYAFIPWLVFREVEAEARTIRQRELAEMLKGIDRTDLGSTQAFVAEFARCRQARIRPMSLGPLQLGGFATVVLLPILLTLLQVLAPLGLGRD